MSNFKVDNLECNTINGSPLSLLGGSGGGASLTEYHTDNSGTIEGSELISNATEFNSSDTVTALNSGDFSSVVNNEVIVNSEILSNGSSFQTVLENLKYENFDTTVWAYFHPETAATVNLTLNDDFHVFFVYGQTLEHFKATNTETNEVILFEAPIELNTWEYAGNLPAGTYDIHTLNNNNNYLCGAAFIKGASIPTVTINQESTDTNFTKVTVTSKNLDGTLSINGTERLTGEGVDASYDGPDASYTFPFENNLTDLNGNIQDSDWNIELNPASFIAGALDMTGFTACTVSNSYTVNNDGFCIMVDYKDAGETGSFLRAVEIGNAPGNFFCIGTSGGKYSFGFIGANYTLDVTADQNNFVNLALRIDVAGKPHFYIDGVEHTSVRNNDGTLIDSSNIAPLTTSALNSYLILNRYYKGGYNAFGTVKNLKIFNTYLTDEQVLSGGTIIPTETTTFITDVNSLEFSVEGTVDSIDYQTYTSTEIDAVGLIGNVVKELGTQAGLNTESFNKLTNIL